MVNQRWLCVVIVVLFILSLLGSVSAQTALVVVCSLMMILPPDELKIRAYKIFDRENERDFEQWISERPDMAEALQYIQNLSTDDFMTFSRLAVEVRYRKDQAALEMVSRQFRKERGDK